MTTKKEGREGGKEKGRKAGRKERKEKMQRECLIIGDCINVPHWNMIQPF